MGILASLSHPNIIQLLGFTEDAEDSVASIVVSWEANGNVREFLKSGDWDIPERISIVREDSGLSARLMLMNIALRSVTCAQD